MPPVEVVEALNVAEARCGTGCPAGAPAARLRAGRATRSGRGDGAELERKRQVVAVPPQALLDLRTFFDQVISVVGEQPDIPLGTGQARFRQTRFPKRGTATHVVLISSTEGPHLMCRPS